MLVRRALKKACDKKRWSWSEMLDNVTNRSRFSAHASKDSDRPKWLLGFRSHSLSGAFDAIRRMATAWLAPKNIILMLVAPSSTTVSIGLRYQILCDNECSAVLRLVKSFRFILKNFQALLQIWRNCVLYRCARAFLPLAGIARSGTVWLYVWSF